MTSIGDRINFIRKENKLTQKKFSEMLGISQAHVSKIEKNVENPSETLLMFISYRFNVDIVWIKTGEVDPNFDRSASKEGTLNTYEKFKHESEKQFYDFTTDETWYYADSYSAFVITMDVSKLHKRNVVLSAEYLKSMSHIYQYLSAIITTSLRLASTRPSKRSQSDIESYEDNRVVLVRKIIEEVSEATRYILKDDDDRPLV